jgi:hypothetical protein
MDLLGASKPAVTPQPAVTRVFCPSWRSANGRP